MRLQNPFAAVSPTGIDSQVLLVLARAEAHFSVSDVHRLLPEGGSLEGVRQALVRLVYQGTVNQFRVGRTSAFSLNRDHLLAPALVQIAEAKHELLRRIAEEIATWPTQPTTVKLFGSAARNEMTDDSDIDLLFVFPEGSHPQDGIDPQLALEQLDDLANNIARWTGNDVRPLVYTEEKPPLSYDELHARNAHCARTTTMPESPTTAASSTTVVIPAAAATASAVARIEALG